MSLQANYEAFKLAVNAGHLSHADESYCGCRGGGWFLSDLDTWHECPEHPGRRHPEDNEPPPDRPILCVTIENADGSEYDGLIGYESDGDRVHNDGHVLLLHDSDENLARAKRDARGWREHLGRILPEKQLKVRLHREWV